MWLNCCSKALKMVLFWTLDIFYSGYQASGQVVSDTNWQTQQVNDLFHPRRSGLGSESVWREPLYNMGLLHTYIQTHIEG